MIYRLRIEELGIRRDKQIIIPISEEGFAPKGTIGEVLMLCSETGIAFCIKEDDTDYFYAKFCHCMLKEEYDRLPENTIIELLSDALKVEKQ